MIAKKIIILGAAGSGKTHLATYLGARFNIPVIYLDKYFFLPGFKRRSIEEMNEIQDRFLKEDTWIMDGNFIDTLSQRAKDADLIIYLKIDKETCLNGIKKRLEKKENRPDLAEGCIEEFSPELMEWSANFNTHYAPLIEEIINKYPEKVLKFKSRKKAYQYFDGLEI